MKFEPNECPSSFVARAAQILDNIAYEDILKASRAGATFYVFVSVRNCYYWVLLYDCVLTDGLLIGWLVYA